MRWGRASRCRGAALALISIALQLFVTFDHVHLEDILGQGPFDPTAVIQMSAPHSSGAAQDVDAADSCALCASIMLAGSYLIPDGPALAPAGFFVAGRQAKPADFIAKSPRYLRAPTRAPPAA